MNAPDHAAPPRERLRRLLEDRPGLRVAPVGRGQGAVWFMQQLDPDGVAYNLMFAARLDTAVDEPALRAAVRGVVERHPALRTVYAQAGGRLFQVVLDEPVHEYVHVDGSDLADDEIAEELADWGHEPLDLEVGPILRLVLLTRDAGDAHVLLVIHHIAADAASADVVVEDLQELYAAAAGGRALPPREPVAPYTDFAAWERAWLAGPEAEAALAWWSKTLEDPPAHLDLPAPGGGAVAARSARQDYEGDDLVFSWGAEGMARLRDTARAEGVPPYTVLLAALVATLHRLTAARDLLLATPVAQRGDGVHERGVGYYLNTLLVRARPDPQRPFRALLHEVHETSLGALEHMDYPLDLLTTELNPPREEGRAPWFDVVVNWLAGDAFRYSPALFLEPAQASEPLPGPLALVPVRVRRRIAKFDLEITLGEIRGELLGQIQYKTAVVARETVESFVADYHRLLGDALAHPDRPLERLGTENTDTEVTS